MAQEPAALKARESSPAASSSSPTTSTTSTTSCQTLPSGTQLAYLLQINGGPYMEVNGFNWENTGPTSITTITSINMSLGGLTQAGWSLVLDNLRGSALTQANFFVQVKGFKQLVLEVTFTNPTVSVAQLNGILGSNYGFPSVYITLSAQNVIFHYTCTYLPG